MRALAFGDLESELWGVIWLPGDEPLGVLALRAGSATSQHPATLRAGATEGPWRLDGDGVSLEFVPTAEGREGSDPDRRLSTEDQLCQVTGRARVEDSEVEVRCLGWRSTVEGGSELGHAGSFRLLAGWLEPAFGFSLIALRPGRARGQESDAVSAIVVEDPAPPPVVDPRLSTTYTDAGLPRRAGLELWLEEEDEDASDDEASPQYPRRAAGEALSAGLDWSQGEFELHASLLRWHSHGREGPGVYLLGRRR